MAIDYGQILQIEGLNLPPTFECHFSKDGAVAVKAIGTTADGVGTVEMIDEQMQTRGTIIAYIYLHEGADDGETEYQIIIPVNQRPGVTPAEPTPVEQDVISQAISALNSAVTQTQADVETTNANAEATAGYMQRAETAAETAETASANASASEGNASASAESASQSATQASQSASEALTSERNAYQSAERAEQAATTAGYIDVDIVDGHLIYTRTDAVDVNFRLANGNLIMEVI